jgi:succinyl-diaminopimelate desuccinylase
MLKTILAKLIPIPSVTADLESNTEALKFCQQHLKSNNILSSLKVISRRPLLHWGCRPSTAEILICTHIDVVPGPGRIFTPRLQDKTLFGRGAADTKAFAAVMLNLPPEIINLAKNKKVIFAITSDEEIGGPSTKQFISHLPALKFGLFGEPTNLKVVNSAKGIMQVKISATGKSAHGSRPWLGENSIVKMTLSLTSFLKHHPAPEKETRSTTFNFSVVSGGSVINQVPETCEMLVDIRLNPTDSPLRIIRLLRRHFSDCQIDILKSELPIKTSPADPFVHALFCSAGQCGVHPQFAFEHGSSDARHCTAGKIPAIVFGPIGSHLHEEAESVDLESVSKVQQIVENFIRSI